MHLSAPGKLFLTGEYAVLWGAPAALAAVAPRMVARLELTRDPGLALRVPGGLLRGRRADGALQWTPPTTTGARFAARALELALAGFEGAGGLALELERGPRGKRGQKLGLGSSAAAVAIAAAAGLLRADPGALDADRVFPLAAQAHWEVQGRRGSNGDVAAACYGGVIVYRRYPLELPIEARPQRPSIERIDPGGLSLALVFSGASAKTPSMVAAVEKGLSPEEKQRFVERSTALTLAFSRALGSGDHAGALAALDASGDLLGEVGARAGVSVVTPGLARIQALGREAGMASKISGAGGGDGALFASFDPGALASALSEARARGYETVALTLSGGVRADEVPPSRPAPERP